MRGKRIVVVGIALFIASCASVVGKPAQTPVGIGSNQQGPSLNGDDHERATGVTLDVVCVVDGQLVWGAAR